MVEPRPARSFFQDGKSSCCTQQGKKMKGGINGGLALLEPNLKRWRSMKDALKTFRMPTDMAEQDCISLFVRDKKRFECHHKKENLSDAPDVLRSRGCTAKWREKPSTYWWLLNHPEEMKVYHYSSSKRPSNMLLQMPTETRDHRCVHACTPHP